MAIRTAHQRLILKVKKPIEVPIYIDLDVSIFVKIFEFYAHPEHPSSRNVVASRLLRKQQHSVPISLII
jgi:hypothetical protein